LIERPAHGDDEDIDEGSSHPPDDFVDEDTVTK
jgi:hypothetical protein